jgi:endo-1,4-beta-xylanase
MMKLRAFAKTAGARIYLFAAALPLLMGMTSCHARLKDAYAGQFLLGNIVTAANVRGERRELLFRHYNSATAENAMKPSSLQRSKGVFTFAEADALVDAALSGGMKMHGHTLVWHEQSPEWMNSPGIPRDGAVENLTVHIKTVAGHFKGRVSSWDVVNEALNDNPARPQDWRAALRQSPWYQAVGPEYVELAFLAAREADPDAKLYYNDYNLDNLNKSLAVYNLVKELNEKYPNAGGRPLIDGVGMQGHYGVTTSVSNVERSLKLFSSLGIEVSISELDVQAGSGEKLTEPQAAAQGIAYAKLFQVFKKYAADIGRVTFWGLDDGTSWRKAASPTLFDKELKAKLAFYAVLDPDKFIGE